MINPNPDYIEMQWRDGELQYRLREPIVGIGKTICGFGDFGEWIMVGGERTPDPTQSPNEDILPFPPLSSRTVRVKLREIRPSSVLPLPNSQEDAP